MPLLPAHCRRLPASVAHAARLLLVLAGIILLNTSHLSGADVDEAKLASYGATGLLRWENIQGDPYWVSGTPLTFDSASQLHVAKMTPGHDVQVHVPAGSILRVAGTRQPLRPTDVQLWVSNGSGLYRETLSGIVGTDGSLLIVPSESKTSLVRISLPSESTGCVEAAFFLSRRLVPDVAFPYPCQWIACGPAVRLSSKGTEVGRYQYLSAGQPTRFQVTSPARLRIESRLEYPAFEAESRQTYELHVDDGQRPQRVLPISTQHERRHVIEIDGVVRSVGEYEVDYVDIPAGTQQCVIESTANAFLRITAAPCHTAYPTGWLGDVDETVTGSIWSLRADDVLSELAAADYPASRRWRIAQRVARDNQYRDGGIQAWNVLRHLAAQNPAHTDLNRWANKVKFAYTWMQQLAPDRASEAMQLEQAYFVTRPLPSPAATPYSPIISTSLTDAAIMSVSSGQFVLLPAAGQVACQLPPGVLDTQIRLAVNRDVPSELSELSVQYDSSPPIRMRMYGHETLPADLQQPSTAESGLAALNRQFGPFDAGTLGGPFASRRSAAPRIEAATANLNVARETRWVRVTNHSSHPLRVCLHYRASRKVVLSEMEFLANVARQPDFSATLLAALGGRLPATIVDRDASEELRNHCAPFIQKLRIQKRSFAARVASLPASQLVPHTSHGDVKDEMLQARRLMQQRQWVAALELWTRIANESEASERQEAIAERVHALIELGESFLADMELRGRVLSDPDPAVRTASRIRLADIYRREGDHEALQRLASAALLTDPSSEQMAQLAEAAVLNGDWSTALLACLATPPDRRSTELLLQATYQSGWWQLFHHTLTNLQDQAQRNYWHALWKIRQGDYANATQLLEHAGERGVVLSRHIASGNAIAGELRNANVGKRLAAIRQWERWVVTHPGPHVWRPDDSVVAQCRRIDQVVYDPGGNGYSMYRGSATHPVRLHVAGPVDLQIDVRPLHRADAQKPLNDWLIVRGSGREQVWPVTENRRSDGLSLRTDPDYVPGRRERTNIRLGPGQHELEVAMESTEVLVRVSTRRPSYPLAMLPPITPATVSAVVHGQWGQTVLDEVSTRGKGEVSVNARLVINDPSARGLVTVPLLRQWSDVDVARRTSAVVTPWQRALLGLRDGSLTAAEASRVLDARKQTSKTFRSDELLELMVLAGLPTSAMPRVVDPQIVTQWQWMSVYQGQLREALRVDPGRDPAAMRTHIALLTRLAEQQPSTRAECAVQLAKLAQRDPMDRFAAKQLDRIKEPGQWVVFREVDASGGLYALPNAGPKPLAQASRIRHALARRLDAEPAPADYLITGYRRLSLDIVESHPVTIELVLRQPQISFLPSPRLQVEVQVDEAEPQLILLPSTDQVHRVQLPLAAGQHRIRVRNTNPFAGHYVFLNVYEVDNVDEVDSAGHRLSWDEQGGEATQRLYHVATRPSPVQLTVNGPSWIRVERIVDGRREINETTIEAGRRQMTLAAPPGEKYVLYRIWEYRFGEAPAEPPVFAAAISPLATTERWLDQTEAKSALVDLGRMHAVAPASYLGPSRHPELTGLASADAPASNIDVADAFPLGGYEDGTWGMGTGLARRRALEEGRQLTGEDRFLQFFVSHEHYRAASDSYAKTLGVLRLRESSGPTLGLLHEQWTPIRSLVDRLLPSTDGDESSTHGWLDRLKAHNVLSSYFQRPSDPLPMYDGQTEISLGIRSRLYYRYDLSDRWFHLPSATFIGRWLSLDQTRYLPTRVDQDVFTPFKNDHRIGLYLTDTWIYEPREFSRVWMRPAVYTNEDLNPFRPDHISLKTGVSNLWHNVDWQVAYRVARFSQDEDRREARTQHLLYLDAVLDRWRHSGQRYELAVNVRYQVADGETSAFLTLTRFLSRGRGYRDHHPSEVGFRSLRERRAFSTWQFSEPLGL